MNTQPNITKLKAIWEAYRQSNREILFADKTLDLHECDDPVRSWVWWRLWIRFLRNHMSEFVSEVDILTLDQATIHPAYFGNGQCYIRCGLFGRYDIAYRYSNEPDEMLKVITGLGLPSEHLELYTSWQQFEQLYREGAQLLQEYEESSFDAFFPDEEIDEDGLYELDPDRLAISNVSGHFSPAVEAALGIYA